MSIENENVSVVRIWEIIPLEYVKGAVTPEFSSFDIYQYVTDGVVRENMGLIRDVNDTLFYDVSNASPDFKESFRNLIIELEVKTIIQSGEPKITKKPSVGSRIVSILPLDGIYSSLSKSELIALGNNFVIINDKSNGQVSIRRIISTYDSRPNGLPPNLFLKLDVTSIPTNLMDKLSSEIVEFTSVGYGLYQQQRAEGEYKLFY